MTSARKQFTNRANAKKSTGPRTAAGKARSSRNALRHGFTRRGLVRYGHTVAMLQDAGFSQEIEEIARTIVGAKASAERYQRACEIAAAQLDLKDVRAVRHELELAVFGGLISRDQASVDYKIPESKRLAQLSRLARYEQRALARRRFAVRALDALPDDGNASQDFLQNEANE